MCIHIDIFMHCALYVFYEANKDDYISNRLYDQLFILCIQNNIKCGMYRGVSTSLPLCRLQCLTIRRTFHSKVFTACKKERNIFEVLLNCKHIKDVNN